MAARGSGSDAAEPKRMGEFLKVNARA